MSGLLRYTQFNRLTKPNEYKSVFKSKVRSRDNLFLIVAKKNPGNIARLGIAVSKKSLKRAVDRNRIKRIIRESFRKSQNRLSGLDIVVVLYHKNKIPECTQYTQYTQALEKHWEKISLCKDSC